jgi:hypothetical protein
VTGVSASNALLVERRLVKLIAKGADGLVLLDT